MSVSSPGCGNNLLSRRVGFAVSNVFGNGPEKQEGLLKNKADVLAVFGYSQRTDIHSIQKNCTFRDIVKPAYKVDDRALAGSAMPYQADHFTRLYDHADVSRHTPRAIAKSHAAQFDPPLDHGQVHGLSRFGNTGNVIKYFKDTFGACCRFLRKRNNAAH